MANEMSSQISVIQNLLLNYLMNYVDALNLVKTGKCDRAMYWIQMVRKISSAEQNH